MKYLTMLLDFIINNPLLQATSTVILLMVANQIMGTSLAKVKEEFDIQKLKYGIFKTSIYIVGWSITVSAGVINPNLFVVNINNIDVNIIVALTTIATGGSFYYAYEVITKFSNLFKSKYIVKEIEPINNVEAKEYVFK